jgi:CBS domain containing-hemolysin-like protein
LSIESIRSSLVKVNNVPETKPLLDILKEFQLTRTQIAIVIDEHGGTAGIISFSDILNYLAGYNNLSDYSLGVKQIDKNIYLFDSSYFIKDVEKKINVELISDNTNILTIGGFVIHLFGHIPTVGEEIKYKNLLIKVIEVKGNRLKLIKIFQEIK